MITWPAQLRLTFGFIHTVEGLARRAAPALRKVMAVHAPPVILTFHVLLAGFRLNMEAALPNRLFWAGDAGPQDDADD